MVMLEEVKRIADEIFSKCYSELKDCITFKIDNIECCGICKAICGKEMDGTYTITINENAKWNEEEDKEEEKIRSTILHELCHILLGLPPMWETESYRIDMNVWDEYNARMAAFIEVAVDLMAHEICDEYGWKYHPEYDKRLCLEWLDQSHQALKRKVEQFLD